MQRLNREGSSRKDQKDFHGTPEGKDEVEPKDFLISVEVTNDTGDTDERSDGSETTAEERRKSDGTNG